MADRQRRQGVLMIVLRGAVLLVLLLSFTGCGSPSPDRGGLGADARLVLHQSLRVPPNSLLTLVQGGLPVDSDYLLWYEPFCQFRLRSSFAEEQFIEPGAFTITRIRRRQASASMTLAGAGLKIRVAGPVSLAMFENYTDYITELGLSSKGQPNISDLICHDIDESTGTFLDLARIQQILGLVATLEGVSEGAR